MGATTPFATGITRPGSLRWLHCLALLAVAAGPGGLHAGGTPPLREIELPGRPVGVVVTPDQQWIFVSLVGAGRQRPGIAVLENRAGRVDLARTVGMDSSPTGIVLSRDGTMLIAAAGDEVVFLDTGRLESGKGDAAFQWLQRESGAGCINVNVTPDDRTLFVSEERERAITVVNLDAIRALGRESSRNWRRRDDRAGPAAAVVGSIPTGNAPIALTFSPEGRWLFTTCEVAAPEWNWPRTLARETGPGAGRVPEGAVVVVDVPRARTDPPHSVVARVPAGGSTVRAALAPDGARLFVTARNSDAVLVFATADLTAAAGRAKPVVIPVGRSPVPVVVTADGRFALVGNSNRFGADATRRSTLSVLDTARIGTAANPVIGRIPCGAFPREFCLAPDGRTLFLTDFQSDSLDVIDTARLGELVTK